MLNSLQKISKLANRNADLILVHVVPEQSTYNNRCSLIFGNFTSMCTLPATQFKRLHKVPLTANILYHKLNVQRIILMANIDLWLEKNDRGWSLICDSPAAQHIRSNVFTKWYWNGGGHLFLIRRFTIDMCRMSR